MEYKFSELFSWTSGKPITPTEGNIPIYGSNGIIGYTEKAKYNNKIILGRVGAYCGSTAYCSSDFNATDNTLITFCDESKITYPYAYYLLKQYHLNDYAGGAAQPLITQSILKHLKCDIPTIEAQEKIVDILSKYDELIELNNKRIKLLEQAAEELHKEWFVRFRFPNYQTTEFENGIPKGWESTKLINVAFESGIQEQKENREKYSFYVPIDCLSSKSMAVGNVESVENAESSLIAFNKDDILFGAMRPYFHKVTLMPFGGLTRSTCFVISPFEEEYRYYLYMTLFQKSSVDYATTVSVGSTMPYVRWNDFSRLSVIKPTLDIVSLFTKFIEPTIKEIHSLYFMNNSLIKQRDYLLPRLMSGKLEV